jgi:hypothetical protein
VQHSSIERRYQPLGPIARSAHGLIRHRGRASDSHPLDADVARRLHELRNAINAASVASNLLRRSLQAGLTEDALDLAIEAENACSKCSSLLRECDLQLS